jgi:VanZ family protein
MTLPLRFRRTWMLVGWALVLIVVYASLTGNPVVTKAGINDKFEHFAAYGTLSFWFAGIYPRSRYAMIAAGLFLLGVSMEFLQGLMREGRVQDYLDVIANTAGIAMGLTVAIFWLGGWAQRLERVLAPKPTG